MMIAESKPEEKDVMVALVRNFLSQEPFGNRYIGKQVCLHT